EAVAAFASVAVAGKEEYAADPIFGKAIDGRINKQIKEICLLNQAFVRTDLFDGNVGGYVANVAKQLGADIKVTGFTRFQRGEGIEKKADNFAAEIASMVK
ncbi:MAG: elongation factor Ts, partial [Clostridia bacterium]|nr:elongation factor Ts [Clostridia bacterium]